MNKLRYRHTLEIMYFQVCRAFHEVSDTAKLRDYLNQPSTQT